MKSEIKLLYTRFETCFDRDSPHLSVLGAKDIPNPDFGAILIYKFINL